MDNAVTERQRRYTLFMLVLVFTSSHVDRQIMGILGQPIKESLLITDTQLGLLTGIMFAVFYATLGMPIACLLYTSPSPRDATLSRMPSSA